MKKLRSVKQKITRLRGRISDSKRLASSVVTEIQTPEKTVTRAEFASFDCGCHFDPNKIFVDRFTSAVVCRDCTVTCAHCSTRVWVGIAAKSFFSDEFFCPRHSYLAHLKSASKLLLGGM